MFKKLFLFLLLLIIVLNLLGCKNAQMNLRGKVIDNANERIIAKANIEVGNRELTTNNNGYFMVKNITDIGGLSNNNLKLKISAPGYKTSERYLNLEDGDKIIKIRLKRKYMHLIGRVVDKLTGKSLVGATIEIGDKVTETKKNGVFEFKNIHAIPNRPLKDRIVITGAVGYKIDGKPILLEEGTKSITLKLESKDSIKFFFVEDKDGIRNIYLADIYGEKLNLLTNSENDDWSPSWSSNRKKLLFLSNRDGNTNIYIMNADGSKVEQITDTKDNKEDVIWMKSNDILFTSNRDGDYEIYYLNLANNELRQLTNNKYYDGQPTYSLERKLIAYISKTTGKRKLHLMSEDGSRKMVLKKKVGTDSNPHWSKNGDELFYINLNSKRSTIYKIAVNNNGLEKVLRRDNLISNYDIYNYNVKGQLILYINKGVINLLTNQNKEIQLLKQLSGKYTDLVWKQ